MPEVDGISYDVSIDDTDGQNETSEFGIRYTTGIDGYILVFSVRSKVSWYIIKALNTKLLDTLNAIERKGVREIPRVLVATQIDLVDQRVVRRNVAESWAVEEGIPYIEASAFTPYNALKPFTNILQIIDHNLKESHSTYNPYQHLNPQVEQEQESQSHNSDSESEQSSEHPPPAPAKFCSLQ